MDELVATVDIAERRGCIGAEDAERFRNTIRGIEGTRFASMSARTLIDDVVDAFGLEEQPATFTLADAAGDTVLSLEAGEAIEVTFINTHSKARDTVQGVITNIRSAPVADDVRIELTGDVSFRPSAGASVRIDDRRRGHLPRDEPPQDNIRHLFQSSGGGQQQLTGQEVDRAEELLEIVRRAQGEIPPPAGRGQRFAAAQETINRVVGEVAEGAPSPFADSIDELVDEFEALKRAWARWMSDHVSSTTTVRDRRISLERVIEALTTNRANAQETALEFLREYGNV